jgi:hypothetical protein
MSSRLLDDPIIRSADARATNRRGTFIRPEGYTSVTANGRTRRAMTAVLVSCGVLLAFEIVLIVMILL